MNNPPYLTHPKNALFSSNVIVPKIYSYTRFSSEKQRHGDSVRRQIEAAETWASSEGNGLELDTSLRDEGVSGFHGRNAETGALATFLVAIKNGQVAPGSTLLVENLDRISRHDPLKAMRVLETVVEAGVDVVTLQDRRRYTRDNIASDVSNLIIALITFARGNEESRTKSKRLSAVWSNKRKEAAQKGKVLSSWVHPWIAVEGMKRFGIKADFSEARYVLRPERAKVVRQIFKWAISGLGYGRIVQELRARKEAPWGRAGWTITRIAKVIKNRAVIGEYQPCRYEGGAYGKRVPDGAPVPHFFPRVVSDEDFCAAQPTPEKNPRGRPQKRIRLLTGILFDSLDRPMHVHAKAGGVYPTYQTAFNCLAYREQPVRWSAEHLERSVVAACRDIDWKSLYTGDHSDRDRLEGIIKELAQEEAELKRKIGNAARVVLEGTFGDAVKAQVQQLEARLASLPQERAAATAQVDKMRRATAAAPSVATRDVPLDLVARERLRAELRTVLSRIQIWPDGKTPDSLWQIPLEYAKEVAPRSAEYSIAHGQVMGAFRLFFRNGRAITAYVTFLRSGKNRAAKIVGFANPEGMTLRDWDKICSFAEVYRAHKEAKPHAPKRHRRAA